MKKQIVVNDSIVLSNVELVQGKETKCYHADMLVDGQKIKVTYDLNTGNLVIADWFKLNQGKLPMIMELCKACFNLKKMISGMTLPTYEAMKAEFISQLQDASISDSTEYLEEEVFNASSELYEWSDYDIDNVMLNIHYLPQSITTLTSIACDLLKKLNPDIIEIGNNDMMSLLDCYGEFDIYQDIAESFWDRYTEETKMEEFKELIIKTKEKKRNEKHNY